MDNHHVNSHALKCTELEEDSPNYQVRATSSQHNVLTRSVPYNDHANVPSIGSTSRHRYHL